MMFFELRILTLAIIAGIFVVLVILLRRQRLELRYCMVWMIALLAIAVLCIFPTLLDRLSLAFGVETPINMLYLICIAFLACICISLTVFVSSLSSRLRKLIQNIAMMEYESSAGSAINRKDTDKKPEEQDTGR